MTETPALAAAHVITSDAVALGDPEIIIMTQADETGAARVIERHDVDAANYDYSAEVRSCGWRPSGDWTEVERGYWIVAVERI